MKTKKKKIIVLSCVIASVILSAIGSFFAFGGIGILNGEAVAAVSNGAFDATPTDGENTRTISISDLTMSGTNTHIKVSAGIELTLTNCDISGSTSTAVIVQGATLNIDGATSIHGCSTQAALGIGYYGTVNMTAGEISQNTDRGVSVASGSTFNMSGGTITNCSSNNSNGAAINGQGEINISGGTITNCSSGSDGGAIGAYGVLNITGGTITGCSALHDGGGVYSTGTVTMSGGIIHDNTATNTGGGICVGANGSFEMTAGQIYHNSAQNGNEIGTRGTPNHPATVIITGGTISPTAPSGGSFLPDFDANYSQTNENGFDYLLGETVLVPNNSGVAVVFEEEKTE